MPTIREIVDDLVGEGYRITARTVKYYIDAGLIPAPDKEGGYKEGVRLVFKNGKIAKERIKRIYELKGRGYKLSEISEALIEEDKTKYFQRVANWLSIYVERDGRFFFEMIDVREEPCAVAESLVSLFTDPDNEKRSEYARYIVRRSAYKIDTKSYTDFAEVEGRGLIVPTDMINGRTAYDSSIECAIDYIYLHHNYDLSWNTIESLHKQHIKNFDNYIPLPEADGKRFTREWIGWYRQSELNKFGKYVLEYLTKMANGFAYKPSIRLKRYWDSAYDDLDSFVSDFLESKCAFFAGVEFGVHDGEAGMFLRRIERSL